MEEVDSMFILVIKLFSIKRKKRIEPVLTCLVSILFLSQSRINY